MNFNNMTKQQLKDYGDTVNIKLDIRKKKDVLIAELNEAANRKEAVVDTPAKQAQLGFDIKQYIWAIIFIVLLVINAEGANFGYAAGVVTSMIVKDGLIFTLLAWAIMTKALKRESWEWYDWLNALAYTTVIARVLYVILAG
jgi:hypothetical protein